MVTYRFGLEVECFHDNEAVEVGDYHDGIECGEYWNAQRDGSLRFTKEDVKREFGGFFATEFVNNRPISLDELPLALEELKDIVGDRNDAFSHMYINNTCGAHIHFSALRRKLHRNIPFRSFARVRKKAMARIRRELPEVYPLFKKHYYRQHAKKMGLYETVAGERYQEFHFDTRSGVEWRSFNLQGVKSWSELEKMYSIAFNSLMEVLDDGILEHKFFTQAGKISCSDELVGPLEIRQKTPLSLPDMKLPPLLKAVSRPYNFDVDPRASDESRIAILRIRNMDGEQLDAMLVPSNEIPGLLARRLEEVVAGARDNDEVEVRILPAEEVSRSRLLEINRNRLRDVLSQTPAPESTSSPMQYLIVDE